MLLILGVVLIVCSMALSEWLESPQPASPPLHAEKSANDAPFLQSAFTRNIEAKRTMTLKNPRNIFAPLQDPHALKTVKPPSPAPKHVPLPSLQPPPHQPVGPSPSELASRQAKEEMRQYRFLGYLTKAGVRQGFLSKSETIYIVKQGEILEKSITIQSIDATEVVLSKYVKQIGKTVEATLPLTNGDPS